jgi:hypothetical protein
MPLGREGLWCAPQELGPAPCSSLPAPRCSRLWPKANGTRPSHKLLSSSDCSRHPQMHGLLNYKRLKQIRGFLGHISMTYLVVTPSLKGLHLTLASHHPGRDVTSKDGKCHQENGQPTCTRHSRVWKGHSQASRLHGQGSSRTDRSRPSGESSPSFGSKRKKTSSSTSPEDQGSPQTE